MKKLSRPYSVRLSIEKAIEFEEKAKELNLSISLLLRHYLENSNTILKGKAPKYLAEERKLALRYLNKSSNNINQIAKNLNRLNISGDLNPERAFYYFNLLQQIKDELDSFWMFFKDVNKN